MPPKKLKDLSSAPIYTMAHEQQVRLLSDALLREFMHRRGFLATLKTFDEENPRDEETVSSRALMSDLMALEAADQQRLKAAGVETIMEMVCNLRVERRLETEELVRAAATDGAVAEAPTQSAVDALRAQIERQRAEVARATEAAAAAKKKKKKRSKSDKREKKSKTKGGRGSADDAARDDRPRRGGKGAAGPSAAPHPSLAADAGGVTLDDLLGSSSSGSSGSDDSGDDHSSNSSEGAAGTEGKGGKGGKGGGGGAGKTPPAWLTPSGGAAGGVGTDSDDVDIDKKDDDDGDDDNDDSGDDGVGPGGGGVAGGTPVDADTAESVCRLLCGRSYRTPPLSYLQQGFCYEGGELDYALVQWRRGPAAALAVVQALVISHLYERDVYMNLQTRQRDCLRRALSTILFLAQPDPTRVVLVNGALNAGNPHKGFAARMFGAPALQQQSAFHVWSDFTTAEEVEDALGVFVGADGEHWRAPQGCGLWCFLLSVCLSRGVATVARDMATGGGSSPALLQESTGDGGPELASLMLTGRATPRPQPRSSTNAGPPSGFLDGDAAAAGPNSSNNNSSSGSVASALVDPGYPSWVVHHGGHYTNLFMKKDTRRAFRQRMSLSGAATAEAVFWDAVTEEPEYTLRIEVAPLGQQQKQQQRRGGGGGSEGAAAYVQCAVQQVPDWRGAAVVWSDGAPLR